MANPRSSLKAGRRRGHPLHPIAAACLLGVTGQALAQSAAPAEPTLKPVTVDARSAAATAEVTGFGDMPLSRSPFSAAVVDSQAIVETGSRRLADLYRLDASISDAYNAPGYWDFASVRGYVLHSRDNYRRDGLPMSSETTLPLENIERIEILKGPASALYGSEGVGGVVQVFLRKGREGLHPHAAVTAGSEGQWSAGAGVQGASSGFGYALGVQRLRDRGFNATQPYVPFGNHNPDRDPLRQDSLQASVSRSLGGD